MKVITTEKAIEYLNKVLDDWGAFCKTHTNITEAIKIILAENENLKEGIKRQQAVIERLNNNMDAMVKEHNNLMKTIKEDIIREFEEKVKAKMTKYDEADGSYSFNVLTIEDITLIANEMTGGEEK